MALISLTLQRNHIRALACFMAEADIRYYLNGLKVEASPQGTFLVATDGHRLGVFRDDSAKAPEACDFIIPAQLVKTVKTVKAGKAGNYPDILVTFDTASQLVTVGTAGIDTQATAKAIEGRYPDWRRVIPDASKASGEGAHFQPEYVADVGKAYKLAAHGVKADAKDKANPAHKINGTYTARWFHDGNKGTLVTFDGIPSFLGVVMPLRMDAHGEKPPAAPDVKAFASLS